MSEPQTHAEPAPMWLAIFAVLISIGALAAALYAQDTGARNERWVHTLGDEMLKNEDQQMAIDSAIKHRLDNQRCECK